MVQETPKVMGELKMVKLASITPSPTNPRKIFDEDAIVELSGSIREMGVISPVMLRPLGKDTYELVCGERRYRASLLVKTDIKERDTIPAYIREMSDEEALELQITENLQRKDVHPMDEASAFAIMLTKYPDTKEVSVRVAKSEYFVKQRLKLNDLSENWQKVFYNNKIQLADALTISTLAEAAQQELWNSKIGKGVKPNEAPEITFSNWDFNNKIGNLKQAPFDLEDVSLDKKAGACTGCSFNSKVSALFPDMQEKMNCSNIGCFKNKSTVAFEVRLKEAKEDPTVTLVSNAYYEDKNDKVIAALKKEKREFLTYGNYSLQSAPEFPDREDYDDEEDYNSEVADYNKELEDFNKAVERGKFTKAFMLDGNGKGHFVYITIRKVKAAPGKAKKNEEVTVDSIKLEIDGINTRAKRSVELDGEKVHARVKEALKASEYWYKNEPLSQAEYIGAAVLLHERIGWTEKDVSKKIIGKAFEGYGNKSLLDHLSKLSLEEVITIHSKLLRFVMFKELCSANDNPAKSSKAAAIRGLAIQYIPEDVKTFDLEQQEVAIKRKERSDKRLADLKKQQKELEASTKPKAEKKPATESKPAKKAAKKK